MSRLARAEVTLNGSFETGYVLVDTVTGEHLSETFTELKPALRAAVTSGAKTIYHQDLDACGRPLGPPLVLLKGSVSKPHLGDSSES